MDLAAATCFDHMEKGNFGHGVLNYDRNIVNLRRFLPKPTTIPLFKTSL